MAITGAAKAGWWNHRV